MLRGTKLPGINRYRRCGSSAISSYAFNWQRGPWPGPSRGYDDALHLLLPLLKIVAILLQGPMKKARCLSPDPCFLAHGCWNPPPCSPAAQVLGDVGLLDLGTVPPLLFHPRLAILSLLTLPPTCPWVRAPRYRPTLARLPRPAAHHWPAYRALWPIPGLHTVPRGPSLACLP